MQAGSFYVAQVLIQSGVPLTARAGEYAVVESARALADLFPVGSSAKPHVDPGFVRAQAGVSVALRTPVLGEFF